MRQWSVTAVAVLCLCAGVAAAPIGPGSQQAARWYDAYDQAVKALAGKAPDWKTAEAALLAARDRGPAQGPNVMFPGEIYKPFVPDYYLGVVYLNTGRASEAERAFGRVRAGKLIDQKDRLYATFDREAKTATYNRASAQAKQMIAAKDFAGAEKAIGEASDTRFNDTAVKNLREELDTAMKPASLPTGAGTPGYTPNQNVGLGDVPPRTTPTPPPTGPGGSPEISGTRGNTKGPRSRGPASPPAKTAGVPTEELWAIGLRAFLSGNYWEAADHLATASTRPDANARVGIYLACAHAALVLTGQADRSLLDAAKAQYNADNLQGRLTAEDRRVISPRLQALLSSK